MTLSMLKLLVAFLVFGLIGYRFIAAWTPVWLDTLVLLLTAALVASSIYFAHGRRSGDEHSDSGKHDKRSE